MILWENMRNMGTYDRIQYDTMGKYEKYGNMRTYDNTSSAAQGGGGSFKNRSPIGEIGCCESRMAERIH